MPTRQLNAVTPTADQKSIPVSGGGTINIREMPNYKKGRVVGRALEGLASSTSTSPVLNLDCNREQPMLNVPSGGADGEVN